MNYIQVTGLHTLFKDNTFREFTLESINAGVTPDSIIYIICQDDITFGEEFKDGETFIWAKGNFYGGLSITDDYIKSLFETYIPTDSEIMTYEDINNIVNTYIKI